MPLQRCQVDGKDGWKYGESGKCYTGPDAKQKAIAQGIAMGEIEVKQAAKQAPVVLSALKLNEERREATAVFVRSFDGTAKSLDLDGEAVSKGDALKMTRLFMAQRKLDGHDVNHDRTTMAGELVEIFFNDDRIASPHFPLNTGIATLKYSPLVWAKIKGGELTGLSYDVGVVAEVVETEVLIDPSEVRTAGEAS